MPRHFHWTPPTGLRPSIFSRDRGCDTWGRFHGGWPGCNGLGHLVTCYSGALGAGWRRHRSGGERSRWFGVDGLLLKHPWSMWTSFDYREYERGRDGLFSLPMSCAGSSVFPGPIAGVRSIFVSWGTKCGSAWNFWARARFESRCWLALRRGVQQFDYDRSLPELRQPSRGGYGLRRGR